MTHIMEKIEMLQERLNDMITNNSDNMKLYQISTELDTWIVKFYKEKQTTL